MSLRSFSIKEAAYTLIAVLVVPLAFFLLLEASLRWLNVGQDFGYFRHIEIEGDRSYRKTLYLRTNSTRPSLTSDRSTTHSQLISMPMTSAFICWVGRLRWGFRIVITDWIVCWRPG